jgi:transposase
LSPRPGGFHVAPPDREWGCPSLNRNRRPRGLSHGNPYLRLRDRLGTIFTDAQFAPLFAPCGQPAECPWRLALVTLHQFAENLSDRRAAEAVRGRIDWKYLLGLELIDPGFDASVLSVLSEFRGRLVAGGAEEHLLPDTARTWRHDWP